MGEDTDLDLEEVAQLLREAEFGDCRSVLQQLLEAVDGKTSERFAPWRRKLAEGGMAELYLAAAVDGASRWTMFRRITLPALTPLVLVVLIFRTIDAFRVFDAIYVLTPQGKVVDLPRSATPVDVLVDTIQPYPTFSEAIFFALRELVDQLA